MREESEAEQLFLAVLAERPQLARALLGLAHARHGLGDRPGTLQALKDAREQIPEDGEVALWTARLALELGDGALAASASRAAARSFANQGGDRLADAFASLAWAEWHNGRADRAARELRKALAIRPDDAQLRLALVEALEAFDDPAAVPYLEAAIVEQQVPHYVRRRSLEALGRLGRGNVGPHLQDCVKVLESLIQLTNFV